MISNSFPFVLSRDNHRQCRWDKKAIAEYIRNQLQEDIATDQMSLVEYVDPFTGKQAKEGK